MLRVLSPITARPRTPPGVGTPLRASGRSAHPQRGWVHPSAKEQTRAALACRPQRCYGLLSCYNVPSDQNSGLIRFTLLLLIQFLYVCDVLPASQYFLLV